MSFSPLTSCSGQFLSVKSSSRISNGGSRIPAGTNSSIICSDFAKRTFAAPDRVTDQRSQISESGPTEIFRRQNGSLPLSIFLNQRKLSCCSFRMNSPISWLRASPLVDSCETFQRNAFAFTGNGFRVSVICSGTVKSPPISCNVTAAGSCVKILQSSISSDTPSPASGSFRLF